MKTYTKFLVVRHPIPRLVSSYWDKLTVHPGLDPLYIKIRKSVLHSVHPEYGTEELARKSPQFQDFIGKLLNPDWQYHSDRHWSPFHKLCSPCAIPWDYTLRLESIEDEADPILRKLAESKGDLEHLADMLKPKNKSPKHETAQHEKNVITEMLNLTLAQRIAISAMFKTDLDLYGYGFDPETAKVSYDFCS